jgi:hypothetical protein
LKKESNAGYWLINYGYYTLLLLIISMKGRGRVAGRRGGG